jgi:hypothetical protein
LQNITFVFSYFMCQIIVSYLSRITTHWLKIFTVCWNWGIWTLLGAHIFQSFS